ncbi:hypothetical protein FRC00_013660 [Tulasnella sp. 408]|nr:hypothetical protein FRC00_013660 [Tulasnella sp. 408]
MNPNPRLKRKRRPNITSEGLPTPSSAKRKSDSSAVGSDKKRRRLTKWVRLDLNAFVSLNETVMARVCQYLHPVDMLTLSRTSKLLRAIFMSKKSKPCWDESRLQLGIPAWRHVSSPRAMAFIFERTCQNDDHVLMLTSSIQSVPATSTNEVRKGRFHLKEDVLTLWRHFQLLKDQPSWATTAFRAKLIAKQRQRAAAAVEIRVWLSKTIKRQRARFKERWLMISAVMASRWRWDPVPYEELPGRLKDIVDYLIKLPNIPEDSMSDISSGS